MDEKVSIVEYIIQLTPERSSKVVHVDQLCLYPCHQERTNWIRDELVHQVDNRIAKRVFHPLLP